MQLRKEDDRFCATKLTHTSRNNENTNDRLYAIKKTKHNRIAKRKNYIANAITKKGKHTTLRDKDKRKTHAHGESQKVRL